MKRDMCLKYVFSSILAKFKNSRKGGVPCICNRKEQWHEILDWSCETIKTSRTRCTQSVNINGFIVKRSEYCGLNVISNIQ